jgi:Fe-S-cluster containining protein
VSSPDPAADARWYAGGLRFACTRCGNCCVGPGSVRVSDAEIARLAERLELTESEFRAIYTRPLRGGDVSLRETSSGACVFHRGSRGCAVYADRPRQCRSWPFWRAVTHSPERWAEEAQGCPGMNRGPLHPAGWIEAQGRADGTSGRVP